MTVNYYTQRVTVPTAFVTKGRQRVKQFSGHGNGSVYLKNGDEFEIELFNPTSEKVLAKISLNGKNLGSGIILRPGERVFLERYLDEAKRFKFETYEVETGNPNIEAAIRQNGMVTVEFHEEFKNISGWILTSDSFDWYQSPPQWQQPHITYTSTYNTKGVAHTLTSGVNSDLKIGSRDEVQNISYCCVDGIMDFAPEPPKEFKETGRVEKGSNSDQSFVYDNTNFNTWYTWRTSWQILPESQRPIMSKDVKVFCTKCGAKQKRNTYKFCPICGTKYE